MPTYDFKCERRDCGYEFEHTQKMDDPNPPCPYMHVGPDSATKCGGKTKKLITRSSFVLKGDGWATDGYGGGSVT